MSDLEPLFKQLIEAFPEASIELIPNDSPANQPSLLVAPENLVAIAQWLKEQSAHQYDYLSNVTGVDRLDETVKEKVKKKEIVDGKEVESEETSEQTIPGYLEVVYHLFSTVHRHGPLTLRTRTSNRSDQVTVPSLTPLWRSADFQEREIFDLYGIIFEGHPDLRRLLMWDEFEDHPMRKDYVDPDDFEYEPTPHGSVLERAKAHQPSPTTEAPEDTPGS